MWCGVVWCGVVWCGEVCCLIPSKPQESTQFRMEIANKTVDPYPVQNQYFSDAIDKAMMQLSGDVWPKTALTLCLPRSRDLA